MGGSAGSGPLAKYARWPLNGTDSIAWRTDCNSGPVTENIPAPIHLSAKQAGEAAREAAAQRLILTHLWPMIDRTRAIEEGSEAFGTGVTLATQGLVTTI